jgi:hypothetical protein
VLCCAGVRHGKESVEVEQGIENTREHGIDRANRGGESGR